MKSYAMCYSPDLPTRALPRTTTLIRFRFVILFVLESREPDDGAGALQRGPVPRGARAAQEAQYEWGCSTGYSKKILYNDRCWIIRYSRKISVQQPQSKTLVTFPKPAVLKLQHRAFQKGQTTWIKCCMLFQYETACYKTRTLIWIENIWVRTSATSGYRPCLVIRRSEIQISGRRPSISNEGYHDVLRSYT